MLDAITPEKLTARKSWITRIMGLLVLVIILRQLSKTVADPDLWGYLAFGRLFWETGEFPYHDVFSYVPTYDLWIYHEWLTGVIFYPLYKTFGAPVLQLLKYGLGLATVGLIFSTARQRGASALSMGLIFLLIQVFLIIGYSPVRAQVFTYFFFTLTLYLLETARQTRCWRRLGFLILIQVLWCNLHGGFVAGLGLICLYGLGEALSRRPFWPYLVILLLSGLATLVNPYGLEYWDYIIRAISRPRPEITEWASVFHAYQVSDINPEELLYLLSVIIFSILLAWWARWREFTAILALSVTLILGLKHIRHIVFFLILAGAYLPLLLSAYLEVWKSNPQFMARINRLGWKIPTLVGMVFIVFFSYQFIRQDPLSLKTPARSENKYGSRVFYPVGAVDYIRKHHLRGKLLTEFDWGEYLLWMLYPQCTVALDGRFETVYPEAVAKEYFDFKHAHANWRGFLKNYPPDIILIYTKSKVYPHIRDDANWRQLYADVGSALFIRQKNLSFTDQPGGSKQKKNLRSSLTSGKSS